VRALTEKASTAAMPIAAITSASRLNTPISIALMRRAEDGPQTMKGAAIR
jgi:hypothetical protein